MAKKEHRLSLFMVAGLSVLLILRDIYGLHISKYLYFAYILGFMAVASYQNLVYMICFILPLVCGLPGTYIMSGALVLLLLKGRRIGITALVCIVAVTALEVIASLWYPRLDIASVVHYVSFAGVMIYLIHDNARVDYIQCLRMYLWGTVLLCGVIFFATIMHAPSNWLDLFAQGWFRFGEVEPAQGGMRLVLNANSLAYYSLVGVFCGILMAERSRWLGRVVYIAMVIFFGVVGFLTLSRSWMLMMGICLILYVFSKLRNPKQFLVMVLVLAVIMAAVFYYLGQNPALLEGLETRLEDGTAGDGNGRAAIFATYMREYLRVPRFVLSGTGVTQYAAVMGKTGSMHNGTQQILVCCGLIGFLVYMVALAGPVLQVRKKGRLPGVFWLPLLSVILFIQTIQFLNPMMLMLPYVIGIYALRSGGQSVEDISYNGGHGRGRSVGMEARKADHN